MTRRRRPSSIEAAALLAVALVAVLAMLPSSAAERPAEPSPHATGKPSTPARETPGRASVDAPEKATPALPGRRAVPSPATLRNAPTTSPAIARRARVPAMLEPTAPLQVVLGATSHRVEVRDNAFSPVVLTIPPASTVRWENVGASSHSVTASDGFFDSHPSWPADCLEPGETFVVTFSGEGTHAYTCRIHGPAMAGTIVVSASASNVSTAGIETATSGLPTTGASVLTTALVAAVSTITGAGARLGARRRFA